MTGGARPVLYGCVSGCNFTRCKHPGCFPILHVRKIYVGVLFLMSISRLCYAREMDLDTADISRQPSAIDHRPSVTYRQYRGPFPDGIFFSVYSVHIISKCPYLNAIIRQHRGGVH